MRQAPKDSRRLNQWPRHPLMPAEPLALTVAVLAYNEEGNLRRAVEDIVAEVGILGVPWELLLVDGVLDILERLDHRRLEIDQPGDVQPSAGSHRVAIGPHLKSPDRLLELRVEIARRDPAHVDDR